MSSATQCERKHRVQKPIDYMKVEAKVGPIGDPDESFILHSLVCSPALMGFDVSQGQTINWEEWSEEHKQKNLTIKVKVDQDYHLGGFKVSLLSVLPTLDSLCALPEELNIALD